MSVKFIVIYSGEVLIGEIMDDMVWSGGRFYHHSEVSIIEEV